MKLSRTTIWIASGAAAAGFLLGGAAFRDQAIFGPTVASWVQAVGSIVAILASAAVAIFVDRNAAARMRGERDAQDAARYTAGREAIVVAKHAVRKARVDFDAGDGDSAMVVVGEAHKSASNALELVSLYAGQPHTHHDLAFALVYTKRELLPLVMALAAYNRSGGAYHILLDAITTATREVDEILDQLDKGILAI